MHVGIAEKQDIEPANAGQKEKVYKKAGRKAKDLEKKLRDRTFFHLKNRKVESFLSRKRLAYYRSWKK